MSTPYEEKPRRSANDLPAASHLDDPTGQPPQTHAPLPSHDAPKAYVADDEALARVQASAEFQELKKRFRNFAFPLSIAFLIWYFAFVLMSTYAVDFMDKPLLGNVTIGLVWGLLQFLTTFLITALYIRHANKNLDPIASKIRAELEGTNR